MSTTSRAADGPDDGYFVQVHCPMTNVAVRIQCQGDTTIGDILDVAERNFGLELRRGWMAATHGLQLRRSDLIGANGVLTTEIGRDELRYGHERDYRPKKHRLHGDLISIDKDKDITGCWWQIDEQMAAEMQKRGWSRTDFVVVLLCGLTGG